MNNNNHTYLVETDGAIIHIIKKNKSPKLISDGGTYIEYNEITYDKDAIQYIETHIKRRSRADYNIRREQKIKKAESIATKILEAPIIGKIIINFGDLIIKYSFPAAMIGYMIMMISSFVDVETVFSKSIALFMGIFSVFVSLLYSDSFNEIINKKIQSHYRGYYITIKNISLFAIAVIIASAIFVIATEYKMEMLSWIGNFLTWLSLMICFLDKYIMFLSNDNIYNIKRKNSTNNDKTSK